MSNYSAKPNESSQFNASRRGGKKVPFPSRDKMKAHTAVRGGGDKSLCSATLDLG